MQKKQPFEEIIPQLEAQINRRKSRWTLITVPFEDVRQIILFRIWTKYETFNPEKGELSHWAARVITNSWKNIMRDNYLIYARPCIQQCIYNMGNDNCSMTPSGKQCSECKAYKLWAEKKENHHNIKQTLSIETHIKEAEKINCDFQNIEEMKLVVDKKMKEYLNDYEWGIYKSLYIDNIDEKKVGKKLNLKKVGKMYPGYQILLKLKHKFKELAKKIIEDEGLN